MIPPLRSRTRALLLILPCCAIALAAGMPQAPAARNLEAVSETPESQRLAILWHALIDHSSDLIYSRARFDELVEDLDRADADLAALAQQNILPEQVAADLRRLFHARYEYISAHNYTAQSYITISLTESASDTAHWIVELQLSVLRSAYASPQQNGKLIAAAESNLGYELTFLYHADQFEADVDRRRADLKAREDQGETVDWQAFGSDCEKRRSLLVDAYHERRIRRARPVQDLLPLVHALTRATPAPAAAALDSPTTYP